MQPLFEHRLELAGIGTRALELEGGGPPLLLLHGFADSADTWRFLLDRLAREDRRALAVDLPGFGEADPLAADLAVLPQLRAFAEAATRHVAPEGGAIVCGNSLGGCLAMLAAQEPELGIEGIVPVAPAGLDMARWFVVIEREPLLRALLASPVPIPGFLLQRVVAEIYRRLAFRHPERVEPLAARAFAAHFTSPARTAEILATGRRMLPELRHPFELGRISCPVMMVWGERDAMVFQSGAQRVLDTVPGSQLRLIDDCGHCPQIEAPHEVADLLLEFPASLAQAA